MVINNRQRNSAQAPLFENGLWLSGLAAGRAHSAGAERSNDIRFHKNNESAVTLRSICMLPGYDARSRKRLSAR